MSLEALIISILSHTPSDQYALFAQSGCASVSDVTKALARLQRRKIIQVCGYRRSKRTGLEIPIYSTNSVRSERLDVHPLLAGVTSERLVEYDFVSRNLLHRSRKSKILDIGSSGSGLAEAISEFGGKNWQVAGIDLASSGCDLRTDARSPGIRTGIIDQVICISTIEHIGFASGVHDNRGDAQAVREIYRILKKGANAIVTVPYGKNSAAANRTHRVYNKTSLSKLTKPFSVSKKEFYQYSAGRWLRSSEAAAYKGNDEYIPSNFHSAACVCLVLKKNGRGGPISRRTSNAKSRKVTTGKFRLGVSHSHAQKQTLRT